MSHYTMTIRNPRTGNVEEALWMDDYWGRHQYGIRFAGEEHVWRDEELAGRSETKREERT